ncbi:metallophosphoesterase family protein [Gloeobacter violaceus]|nr:metallophosphoesterase [Gloeobacter violaceus]
MPLLSDPLLLWPTADSVRVVWFTEGRGEHHHVCAGDNLERQIPAQSRRLDHLGEDARSHVGEQHGQGELYKHIHRRDIHRHEAIVDALVPGERVPYQVVSDVDGQQASSEIYTLAAAPTPGTPLNILLTSDHQILPMVAANLEKVAQTVGRVDAVFFAGDLVNVPDRASEWFDDNRGNAFFACLQGRAHYPLGGRLWRGGEILQYAPIFPCIGNHEVMGIATGPDALNLSFARPRQAARDLGFAQDQLEAESFNTWSYEAIFGVPPYYAVSFGDVRLVSLYATRIWRSPEPGTRGKYGEHPEDLADPKRWGYGELIFEPICAGSAQYAWLERELASSAFRTARFRVVMLHHPVHGLGGNIVPPYTDPHPHIERDATGQVTAVGYSYPKAEDVLIRDLQPLLEASGVQLVLFGHCHLWNRFTSGATHYLETSNVGNTFGAYPPGRPRSPLPAGDDYQPTGDPNGLEPVIPNLAPLIDPDGKPQAYLASNEITAFSILETATGTVTSYRFDTREPDSPVIAFDAFGLAAL